MHPLCNILILDPDRRFDPALADLLCEQGHSVRVLVGRIPPPPQLVVSAPAPAVILAEIASSLGLDLIGTLHSHRTTRHIPIIALSAQVELEYELLDLFDFLPHPVDKQRLLDDLALIGRGQPRQELSICDPLGQGELAQFQAFLVQHSGLHFDQGNSKILERGLCRRMRALRLRSYGEYYRYLERYLESRQELKKLLGLLTVGETFFFRYRAHFEALQHMVLPELIERTRRRRSLRIWSAGCSTGEEPYSLAMLLLEHFPELADWHLEILATDINYQALRRAREGLYGERALRVTEAAYRERYFSPQDGRLLVTPPARALLRFGYLNLQTGRYPAPDNGTSELDLLLCRNVMIYFRQETNRRIIERFSRALRPGGFLFLGHAETLQNLSNVFLPVHFRGGFYYRLQREPLPQEVAVLPPALDASLPVPVEPPPEPVAVNVAALLARALLAFEREEFVFAEKDFESILQQQADQAQALLGMGFVRANQERYEEALDFCARALAANDLLAEPYFLRGLIFELQGDLIAASEEYRKALLLDLEFIMPHYHLSRVYRHMNRPKEARRELNNSLRLLEGTADETTIPHSGGMSRAVLLEVCREDLSQLGSQASLE